MSFGSTSPALSDRQEFPLFYRTVAPDSSHNPARLAFVRGLGWDTVTALSQNEDVYSLVSMTFAHYYNSDLGEKTRVRHIIFWLNICACPKHWIRMGGLDVKPHVLFNSALDGRELSASLSGCFIDGERVSCYQLKRRFVGPQNRSGLGSQKYFYPAMENPVFQSVASHFVD